MALHGLPSNSHLSWRRLDTTGHERATFARVPSGWRLEGRLAVEEEGVIAELRYRVELDEQWHTRSAIVEGVAAGRPVRIALASEGNGTWTRDGVAQPHLAGAVDIDLGFTPATNSLPIRRLALAVGESAPVTSAWLRFPELRLERLEQTYTREAERVYRYRADVDGELFTARLDTDEYGHVLRYEELWEATRVEIDDEL